MEPSKKMVLANGISLRIANWVTFTTLGIIILLLIGFFVSPKIIPGKTTILKAYRFEQVKGNTLTFEINDDRLVNCDVGVKLENLAAGYSTIGTELPIKVFWELSCDAERSEGRINSLMVNKRTRMRLFKVGDVNKNASAKIILEGDLKAVLGARGMVVIYKHESLGADYQSKGRRVSYLRQIAELPSFVYRTLGGIKGKAFIVLIGLFGAGVLLKIFLRKKQTAHPSEGILISLVKWLTGASLVIIILSLVGMYVAPAIFLGNTKILKSYTFEQIKTHELVFELSKNQLEDSRVGLEFVDVNNSKFLVGLPLNASWEVMCNGERRVGNMNGLQGDIGRKFMNVRLFNVCGEYKTCYAKIVLTGDIKASLSTQGSVAVYNVKTWQNCYENKSRFIQLYLDAMKLLFFVGGYIVGVPSGGIFKILIGLFVVGVLIIYLHRRQKGK